MSSRLRIDLPAPIDHGDIIQIFLHCGTLSHNTGERAWILPLDGFRILDLTRFRSGPYCTVVLAELGADVVKVEQPVTGDDSRRMAPKVNGESYPFAMPNRGKRSISLDLKTARGLEVHRRLVTGADVVIENFVGVHVFHGAGFLATGNEPVRTGNRHPSIAPYGVFGCKDASIVVAVGSESLWQRAATALGLDPGAPGMRTNADRVAHVDTVEAAVNAALEHRTADEELALLQRGGVPAGRIRTLSEVYDAPQVRHLGPAEQLAHPTLGDIAVPGTRCAGRAGIAPPRSSPAARRARGGDLRGLRFPHRTGRDSHG
jgi:crotonobetainyl-CoA:carnitine CoA-transferase CaiB-like acyl-CoA transferase